MSGSLIPSARNDGFPHACGSDGGGVAMAGMSRASMLSAESSIKRISSWSGDTSMKRISSWSSMATNHSGSISRIGSWADMTELEEDGLDDDDFGDGCFTQTITMIVEEVPDSTFSNTDGAQQDGSGELLAQETEIGMGASADSLPHEGKHGEPKGLQHDVKFVEPQFIEAAAESRHDGPAQTTLVLENLPEQLTLSALLDLLSAKGFISACSFVYLPMDMLLKVHLGHALVNISDPDAVASFWVAFDGFADWASPSAAVCRVTWDSERRDLPALVDRFRNSQLMHRSVPDEYRPVLLERGEPVPFPAPTKQIRAPRPHKSSKKQGSSVSAA